MEEVARSGERTPERIVSSLVSPQLLPFSVRGAEWPRQSRGPARGEARAVSRKAVRGSSRELRVAETGVGAQTEGPPPPGACGAAELNRHVFPERRCALVQMRWERL